MRTVVAAAAVSVALIGCGQGDGGGPDPSNPGAYAREEGFDYSIQAEDMTVWFSRDLAVANPQEIASLDYARALLMRPCIGDSGFSTDLPAYDRRAEASEMAFLELGPWTETMAATFGYGNPPDSEEKERLLATPLSEAEEAAMASCEAADADLESLRVASFELQEAVQQVRDASLDETEALDAIVDEFRVCMEERGYRFDDDRGLPAPLHVVGADAEREREIALEHVACLKEKGTVDKWVGTVSDGETSYLAEHREELAGLRARHAEALTLADGIIRDHGAS